MDKEKLIERLRQASQKWEKIKADRHPELPIKCLLIILLIIFLSPVTQTAAARQSMFYPTFEVCINDANTEEIEIALKAVKKTYDFFMSIGYSERYPLYWTMFISVSI